MNDWLNEETSHVRQLLADACNEVAVLQAKLAKVTADRDEWVRKFRVAPVIHGRKEEHMWFFSSVWVPGDTHQGRAIELEEIPNNTKGTDE